MRRLYCVLIWLLLPTIACAGPPKIFGTTVSKVHGIAAAKVYGVAGGGSSPVTMTLNPDDKAAGIVLSDGNLTAGKAAGEWGIARGTSALASGKWYWECSNISYGTQMCGMGTASESVDTYLGNTVNGYGYIPSNGSTYHNNSYITLTSSSGSDVIMVAYDTAAGKLWFGKNGTWFTYGGGVGDPATGDYPAFSSVAAGHWYPAVACYGGSGISVNFGTALSYTPPSGFSSVNHE